MVGKLFKVVFAKKAQRRQRQIFDFEESESGKKQARKVQREIIKQAKKLKKLPESKPYLPLTEEEPEEFRYTKAFSYKIIFTVLKKIGEVLVITVRHDREDPDDVLKDL